MAGLYLRRYTELPALIELLADRKLTLLDPKTWDDLNDRYFLEIYKERRDLATLLALCFSEDEESYHQWHVFAGGSAGVCIRFRPAFVAALRKIEGVRAEPVTYLKLKELDRKKLKVLDLPFLKRYAFQHETEFRIVYESKKEARTALSIPIDLAHIASVTLSPWLPASLASSVRTLLRSVSGCSQLRIDRSTLIGNERWKALGDAAT